MIYKKDDVDKKIEDFKNKKFDVILDFDRTITTGESNTTWGAPSNCGVLPSEYTIERNNLYNYYRPIELDHNLDDSVKMVAMADWQNKHVELFKKYLLNKEQIEEIFSRDDVLQLRNGAIDFLKMLHNKKINLNILSAGIGDFIISYFKSHNIYYDNINIRSNFLDFDRDGVVIGLKGNVMHSLNKIEFAYEKKDNEYAILIGDQTSDIMMVKNYDQNKVLKIGYISKDNQKEIEEFKDVFDIIFNSDEGFDEVINILNKIC